MENQEPNNQQQQQSNQVFTQADVDRIVGERLARFKNQSPEMSETELAEFKKWKSSQKTQAQKEAESAAALATAQAEIAKLKTQGKVSAAECKQEFVEFVTAQVMTMDGKDVDANIKAYKKDHPQYFGPVVSTKRATGVGLANGSGSDHSTNDIMNTLLRNRGQSEI